jgi:universal stress protein A
MDLDEQVRSVTLGANPEDLPMATFVRRILVPTDFSEGANRALTIAMKFAKLLRAAIDLLHVRAIPAYVPVPTVSGVMPLPPPTPDVVQGIQDRLGMLAARVRESGLECQTKSVEGSPGDEIVDYAAKIGADLIVMGSHGRTGLGRILLGSVAEKVLHRATCPVLVVPVREAADPESNDSSI